MANDRDWKNSRHTEISRERSSAVYTYVYINIYSGTYLYVYRVFKHFTAPATPSNAHRFPNP